MSVERATVNIIQSTKKHNEGENTTIKHSEQKKALNILNECANIIFNSIKHSRIKHNTII
jgi:hypothetical protein